MAETQNTGQFAKTIVTDVGKDMIAKSQNGQTLTFSRVALGDGLVGEEEDVTKFTAVKNERLSLPIAKYSNLGNGQFQIQFRLTNSQVESGFWHREIGIMAKIDNGQEQLYAYTTAGNKASFIYDKTTPVEERIVNVNFVIGNAQNLKVIINSSVIYATIEDLEEALDAHDAGADTHEPAFDAHNAADDAHKDFTGATAKAAGKRGMVPAPAAGDQNKALFGDATYKQVVQKVNGVAPDSGGNVNVDMSDYLPLTGGMLTGTLKIDKSTNWAQITMNSESDYYRAFEADDNRIRLDVRDENLSTSRRFLDIFSIAGKASLADAIQLCEQNGSNTTVYQIYGSHNIANKIIDSSGENWIRYTDGTQICRVTTAAVTATHQTNVDWKWTFPMPFSSAPTVIATHSTTSNGYSWIEIAAVKKSNTSVNISFFNNNSVVESYSNIRADAIAIGRWK